MSQKTALIQTRVSPPVREQLEALALSEGMTVSALLRLMVEQVTEGAEPPVEPPVWPGKTRREGKVTVRLPKDVRASLAAEAKAQGVATSTWAAAIIAARIRCAPQPVKSERRVIQRAFVQLQGLATNVNQMAKAMNRGVFTGSNYAPSRDELNEVREGVGRLRADLRKYAEGKLSFQAPPDGGQVSE